MAKANRCGCPNSNWGCSIHSKVKMQVILKDEYKQEKPVNYYSFHKEGHHPHSIIKDRMLKRLEHKHSGTYNVIQFYDENRDKPFFEYYPNYIKQST